MTPFAERAGIECHGSALNPQPALSLSAAPLRTFGAYYRRRGVMAITTLSSPDRGTSKTGKNW